MYFVSNLIKPLECPHDVSGGFSLLKKEDFMKAYSVAILFIISIQVFGQDGISH